MSLEPTPPLSSAGSRRLRRVAWAASSIAVLLIIIAIVTWKVRRDNAPEEYTPGEASRDITSAISERAASIKISPPVAARGLPPHRLSDPLLDPGRPLPSGAPEPRFTDVTQEAGLGGFVQFAGPRTSQLPEDMGSGLAWGDFDNDGFDDLFVVSGGGSLNLPDSQLAPSVLYRNLGNGHFEKVQDFPELRIRGMAAAWGDYNNDGWLDLIVTGYNTIILFRNDHGHLVRDTSFPSPKGFWSGVSWGDYNRDGWLDFYVCGYVRYDPAARRTASSKQFGIEVPFTLNPASFPPQRNLLFRNNGDGTFTEVASRLGVANSKGRSLSALWHDFDGHGSLDLYVANDISENKLFRNYHGKFTDGGRNAWVEEYRGSMGIAAADFDRDGDDDLFISHWIAQGNALFQSLLSEQKKTGLPSQLHFTDAAANTGIAQSSMQSIGWGASFVDIDSDGWLDLLVANGSTFEIKGSTPPRLAPMPSFLYWNAHGEFFDDLAPWNRSFSKPHVSRGLAVADYNNDGAMDVAIVDHGEGVRLLRNDIPQGNWAEFRLHNRVPPENAPRGFGDGATVIAWAGGIPFRRSVGSSSYLSQDSHRIHIGLGAATKIDKLEVHWLRGPLETWTNIPANQIWDVIQGDPAVHPFAAGNAGAPASSSGPPPSSHSSSLLFWEKQHAAMDAMKREHNFAKAIPLFREALALNPGHEDAHYYLANSLAASGDIPGAIAELDALARLNPQSHRAFQRKGELLLASASSVNQLDSAREPLLTALALNPEETGSLLLLAQLDLAEGRLADAERRFAHICQTNPRSSSAWFFRGYLAWRAHDLQKASAMLQSARKALGPDWKPAGAVLEGDVQSRMFAEAGFLNVFAEAWDGSAGPATAFSRLDNYLRSLRK